jgi:hypothetical protein
MFVLRLCVRIPSVCEDSLSSFALVDVVTWLSKSEREKEKEREREMKRKRVYACSCVRASCVRV